MLHGERITLRPVQRGDIPRLYELVEDFEVQVLSSTGPVVPTPLADYEAGFDEQVGKQERDRLWFAIEVDGQLIGHADLHRVDHFNRRCEVGIEIGRDHWGRGFGQDAVRTLVDYVFEHLNMHRVGLQVLAEDPRAVGAYRKAGFVEEGRLRQHAWVRGRYEDELVMSVLREDWTPRAG